MTSDFRKVLVPILSAAMITASLLPVMALSAMTRMQAAAQTRKPAQIVADALSEAGKDLDGQVHVIARRVKKEAMDPEGKDKFVTASGKVLRRTDGKWIFPEEGPASDDEITIVFTGDIIFDTTQNPWSSIAYSDAMFAGTSTGAVTLKLTSPSGDETTYTKASGENAKSVRLTKGVWTVVLTSSAGTSTAHITVTPGGMVLIVK